ncbi:hypothetical protein KJ564_03735 [bacterium]|nr:hypothetical protein [bacterium]
MKLLPAFLMVLLCCQSNLAYSAPYKVETKVFTDEFEDKQDTIFTLIGNHLSDVKNSTYAIEIILKKHISNGPISRGDSFYTFEFRWFALRPSGVPKYGNNLILILDGEKQIHSFSVSEFKHTWRDEPNIEVRISGSSALGLIANIAFSKEVKVKIKRGFSDADPISGKFEGDTIKNIRRFYLDYGDSGLRNTE